MSKVFHEQRDRLQEIKDTLKSTMDGFKEDPVKIAELLEFKSHFWNYSLNNSILIQCQNPYATFVASFRGWQQKGYHVRKGQHGLKVLFPIRTELISLGEHKYRRVADATPEEKAKIESGELKTVTSTRFGVGTVFDISQTDCPKEDYPKFYNMGYSSEQHAALYQAVKDYAASKGIPVEETDLQSISLRGAFYPKENVIRISDKLNDTERLSTLTHELGHALMHHNPEAMKIPTAVKELEADAISIMLQKEFGIGLTDSRKAHLTDNYHQCAALKDFVLEDVLKDINKTYCTLRKELVSVLEPIAAKTQEKAAAPVEQKESVKAANAVAEDIEVPDADARKQMEAAMPELRTFQAAAVRCAVKRAEKYDRETGNVFLKEYFSDHIALGTPVPLEEQERMLSLYQQELGEEKPAERPQEISNDTVTKDEAPSPEKFDTYFMPTADAAIWNDYQTVKDSIIDSILFYQVGSFYQIYGEDAEKVSGAVGLELLHGFKLGVENIAMCSIPVQQLDETVSKLSTWNNIAISAINPTTGERQVAVTTSEETNKQTNEAILNESAKIAELEPPILPSSPAPKEKHKRGNDYRQRPDVLEYIKHNVSMLTVAKDMGFTPVKAGGYYSLKEHDSVRIYPDTNSYCQFSTNKGGSPIDFVMNFGGCNLENAIKKLKEQYVGNRLDSLPKETPKPVQPQPKKKDFTLPEKVAGKYSHAFAYLVKTRCLDAAIVTQCIKDGLIYEDTKHNVVFIGKDGAGKPAFATRHTSLTGSSFKRDVAGSRQDIGWMAGSPTAEKLYICEAPIDALSIMSLRKQQGLPTERASYLATCGTGKSAALFTRLKEYPKINEVVLANDSDTAGKEANRKILERLRKEYPKVTVKLLKPQKGKDINECLCVGSPKTHNRGLEVEK